MRWSIILTVVLILGFLPSASAVDQWGCCVPPFNECFDGRAFTTQSAFDAACTAAGDAAHPATVVGAGTIATCDTVPQCGTGCCCAGPNVFDSPTINNDESLLKITQAACNVKTDFTFHVLPPGDTCVNICGGDDGGGPPPQDETFTVRGTVVNSSDDAPLEGANVSIPGTAFNDTTDNQGAFELRDVPAINVNLLVVHDACQPGLSDPILVDRDIDAVIPLDCFLSGCAHEAPSFVHAPAVKQGTNDVEFTATVPNTCGDFLQYEPFWCIGANCNPLPPTASEVITHVGVDPETTYCYSVRARFQDGSFTESTQACVTTGHEACMFAAEGEWCGYNEGRPSVFSCDANNVLLMNDCEANYICRERSNSAECVSAPVCDACNGLLGLFSHLFSALPINDGLFQSTCGASCNLDSRLSSKPLMVDAYSSCLGVFDCTGYHSQDACVTDICEMGSCTWSFVNEELGQGVCGKSGEPACSSCEDTFGYCTKEMCEAISTDCYFDGENNGLSETYGCLGKDEMACRYYDTEEDCIGGSNAVFNIQYTNGLRTGGDNARTTDSQDDLSIGACTWVGSHCIKDADMVNDGEDDCIENDEIYPDNVECLRDSTPPETEFFLNDPPQYSRIAVRTIPYRVEDDFTPVSEITTNVCFGTGCYPNRTIETIALPEAGTHTVRYYSLDANENSEVIGEFQIEVIDTGELGVEDLQLEENR